MDDKNKPFEDKKKESKLSKKIAKLVGEGYKQKQAVAIAYSMLGKGKKK